MTIRELIVKLLEYDIDKKVYIDSGHVDDVDALTDAIILDAHEGYNGNIYVQVLNIE